MPSDSKDIPEVKLVFCNNHRNWEWDCPVCGQPNTYHDTPERTAHCSDCGQQVTTKKY